MKIELRSFIVALAVYSALNLQIASASAQGTAFTYQGQLQNGGSPASGSYNLTFTLFATNSGGMAVAGPVTNNAVGVTNGLFTSSVDFGPGVFIGDTNWLQIGVASNGSASFTTLTPRQELAPTPYAIYAEGAGSLDGLAVQSNTNGAPNLIGGSSLNYVSGGVLGATVGGGGAANAGGYSYSNGVTASFGTVGGGAGNVASGGWATVAGGFNNTASAYGTVVVGGNGNSASGNGSFVGGGGYDGTYYEPNQAQGNATLVGGGIGNTAANDYSIIVGGYQNAANGYGAFIGGGGYDGGNYQGNQTSGNASVIGGGIGNNINMYADYSALVAGEGCTIDVYSDYGVIGGGQGNWIGAFTDHSLIGGGSQNSMLISGGGTADVIAGGEYNGISTSDGSFIGDSTIAGGNGNQIQGEADLIGGGSQNYATNTYSVVGGGYGNIASGMSSVVVGGGQPIVVDVKPGGNGVKPDAGGAAGNTASGDFSFIGGGLRNVAGGYASTVVGGYENTASVDDTVIGGGVNNNATNSLAVICGGEGNLSGGYASIVAGGVANLAIGDYSFAAGNLAETTNNNTFVWGDGSAYTDTATNNQFVARAANGFIFYSSASGTGASLAPGSGSWASMSDRNAKDGFVAVNPQAVLAEVAALPMTTWSYKSEPGVRHVGPMAQDFHAAFSVGEDDRHIADVDEGGVALAAIQGLNQKLEQKDAQIADLQAQLAELRTMVRQLSADQKGTAQ